MTFKELRDFYGSYIAAGSVITEQVPSGALGIARGRQSNKDGWVAKKKGS